MSIPGKCPRCGEGDLVQQTLFKPNEYSCGHKDQGEDLTIQQVGADAVAIADHPLSEFERRQIQKQLDELAEDL